MPGKRRSSDSGTAPPGRGSAGATSQRPLARNPRWHSGALPTLPTDLPATPQRLLEAARTVLERNGYGRLTLEAISEESGLAHSLIRYHFGSKAGLVGVLIDWVLYETYMTMHRGMTSLPLEDAKGRLGTMLRGLRRLTRDPQSYRLYLDLVVAALHDENLRPMMAESFVGQRRLIMEALDTASGCASKLRADALSAIVVAFSDGLAMQYLADPESVDMDAVFAVWSEMMEQAAQKLEPASSSALEGDPVSRDGRP